MTHYLYGRLPAVFDPPGDAIQTSPLIPGSAALEDVAEATAESVTVLAPPGALERRRVLALALRALKPDGRLDAAAPKDRGGSRLGKELRGFGLDIVETAKAHHRRCVARRPVLVTGLDEALANGGPRFVAAIDAWSQPGVFAWDRLDPGSALLIRHMPSLAGRGADLGCGYGALARVVLASAAVTSLRLVDLDRRAIDAAKRNIEDARARFEWADALTAPGAGSLDFVVSNPPFHEGGVEDRRLGQAFIRSAAELLRKGGVAWIVANRRLPYEADLNAAFSRVRVAAEADGYKLFEATR